MVIEIGNIKIDLPTDNSELGKAVINGKFKRIYKLIKIFVETYKDKEKNE